MPTPYPDPRDMLLSEVDLALVHALQVDARAPWAKVAQVVGVDPATVARRWAAVAEAGWAWFTVWPTPERHAPRSDAALVRVAGPVDAGLLAQWCALPWVLTVERTSAGICAFVVGRGGLAALDARITAAFVRPGLDVAVEYASEVPREDSSWRLRVLSDRQVAGLVGRAATPSERLRPPREEVVDEVAALLREDARMSYGAIAARLGVSDATARRTVERLVGQGQLRVGCDVAMPAVGLGRGAVVRIGRWGSAESGGGESGGAVAGGAVAGGAVAARAVLRHPSVHRVLRTVGPARATVSLRMTSLTELDGIELAWGDVTVLDRWTVTAPLKRNGHLLGPDGRSTGHVDVEW